MSADVSVIIPLYNGAEFIEQTLTSVFAQSDVPREVWVVDDGSSDDGKRLVRQFPQVRLIDNRGRGPAAARNTALELATGENIAFLDQDDLWHPMHLERASRFLQDHRQSAFVFSAQRSFNTETPHFDAPNMKHEWLNPWFRLPTCPVSTPSCVMVPRQRLLAAGAWRTDVPAADLYSYLRLAAQGPVAHLLTATVGYRKSVGSNSNRLRADPIKLLRQQCVSVRQAITDASEQLAMTSELRARLEIYCLLEHFTTPQSPGFATLTELLDQYPQIASDAVSHAMWLNGPNWRREGYVSLHALIAQLPQRRAWSRVFRRSLCAFLPIGKLLMPNMRFRSHRCGWLAVAESVGERVNRRLK